MVGARIRQLRLEEGLSQESLALESGLSRNMIIGTTGPWYRDRLTNVSRVGCSQQN